MPCQKPEAKFGKAGTYCLRGESVAAAARSGYFKVLKRPLPMQG